MKTNIIFQALFSVAALALACMLTSCDDRVNIGLNTSSPYMVVDGTIDNAPRADTIKLSTSIGYLENKPLPPVADALVIVTSSLGDRDTLKQPKPGYYATSPGFVGQIGANYQLEIQWRGETYKANATMPRGTTIDSAKAVYKEKDSFREAGYFIAFYTQEPAGVGDYYNFQIKKNDTLQDLPNNLAFTDDRLVDGNYIDGVELNTEPYKKGDVIVGYGRGITQDAYFFYTELANAVFSGGLFAAPPANVRCNVKNTNSKSEKRASGYFFVASIDSDSLVCGGE